MALESKQYKGKEYAVPAGQEAGRWVKMSEAERNKVYQTHREALGGDFSTDRDKLSKSVLDSVAAPTIPYALEATGKTVSRTLLAAIEKSGLSVDKRGLMMLMLDHLQNGEENQGTGEVNNSGKKNIDRVYASDTTSVYLDSATNRWKLKVVDKNGKARLDGFILPEKGAEDTEPKPAPEPVEEPKEALASESQTNSATEPLAPKPEPKVTTKQIQEDPKTVNTVSTALNTTQPATPKPEEQASPIKEVSTKPVDLPAGPPAPETSDNGGAGVSEDIDSGNNEAQQVEIDERTLEDNAGSGADVEPPKQINKTANETFKVDPSRLGTSETIDLSGETNQLSEEELFPAQSETIQTYPVSFPRQNEAQAQNPVTATQETSDTDERAPITIHEDDVGTMDIDASSEFKESKENEEVSSLSNFTEAWNRTLSTQNKEYQVKLIASPLAPEEFSTTVKQGDLFKVLDLTYNKLKAKHGEKAKELMRKSFLVKSANGEANKLQVDRIRREDFIILRPDLAPELQAEQIFNHLTNAPLSAAEKHQEMAEFANQIIKETKANHLVDARYKAEPYYIDGNSIKFRAGIDIRRGKFLASEPSWDFPLDDLTESEKEDVKRALNKTYKAE